MQTEPRLAGFQPDRSVGNRTRYCQTQIPIMTKQHASCLHNNPTTQRLKISLLVVHFNCKPCLSSPTVPSLYVKRLFIQPLLVSKPSPWKSSLTHPTLDISSHQGPLVFMYLCAWWEISLFHSPYQKFHRESTKLWWCLHYLLRLYICSWGIQSLSELHNPTATHSNPQITAMPVEIMSLELNSLNLPD